MTSTFSKILATGVVIAACVGGAAMPASAATTDDSSSDRVNSTGARNYIGGGTFQLHNDIELGEGKKAEVRGMSLELHEDADHKPTEMVAGWGSWDVNAVAAAAYPILQNGVATGFYIKPEIKTGPFITSEGIGKCAVYQGMPGQGGVEVSDSTSPFHCGTTQHSHDNDWVYDVSPTGR